jgi:serine/threonine-protein kinase
MRNSHHARPNRRTAALLGIAAAAAIHLPPFNLAAYIDGFVFDTWSQIRPPEAPADTVVVTLDDPAWFTVLADIAHAADARLLVATLPQPPSPRAAELALGPTELALNERLLRKTDWQRGGFLWFAAERDGVVREDLPFMPDTGVPSLALAAAQTLNVHTGDSQPAIGDGADGSPRGWLRFYAPSSFTVLSPQDLLATSEQLSGRIVVAGRDSPAYDTPVGRLAAPVVLANFIAGYRDGVVIRVGLLGSIVAWALGLLVVGIVAIAPRPIPHSPLMLPIAGTAGALGLSALTYFALHLWIPPTAPLVLALVTGSLQATRSRRIGRRRHVGPNLEEARAALADGEMDRAWRLYRSIPPTSNLRGELYELGATLERCDSYEQAADVFHRVAVVDPHFRDVAQRLLAAARGGGPQLAKPEVRGAPLQTLGRYEILAIIGEGATGKVFLGRDPKINRLLAIKVIDLATEYETSELVDATDRFRREAETAGRLTHPNIVTVFDIGETDGLAYIAMEYLKGRHLSDFTKPHALLPASLVLELTALTAEALHYAHSQNVVHRDIKPANIMYDSVSGTLKITDFGIARLIDVSRTRTGIVLGTPSFMAPEQLEGKNVNGHTDLFALGVSLYELLAGRLPFRGASMTKLMFVIANEPHPPVSAARPDLPKQLDALLDVALAKNPADRFQTGADMADALRAVAAQMS